MSTTMPNSTPTPDTPAEGQAKAEAETANQTKGSPDAKKERVLPTYTVFEVDLDDNGDVLPESPRIVARVQANGDKSAIGLVVAENGGGSYVAVSRFVAHTVRPKDRPQLAWS
jgi:hypothetical protein